LVRAAALDPEETVRPTYHTGEQGQGFLEILTQAADRFEEARREGRRPAGARSQIHSLGFRSDFDGLALLLGKQLKVYLHGSALFQNDLFCSCFKSSQCDSDLVLTGEDAGEYVFAKLVRYRGDLVPGGKVFQSDACVGLNRLNLARTCSEDYAAHVG
jgi:hypothetical protein